MQSIFYQYNPWWEKTDVFTNEIPRYHYLHQMQKAFSSRDIVMISGLRRIGKTTLMKLCIQWCIEDQKIDPKKILYISVDDYRLLHLSLFDILNEYRKIHKILIEEKIIVFFDEITEQKNFDIQLKTLYDQQNIKIFTSASSSSLLKNNTTALTGRFSRIEVLPLTFSEYLQFLNIQVSMANEALLDAYFEEYLEHGGIPEYVIRKDSQYLKNLIDSVITKDIALSYGVKNLQTLKDMFLLLCERSGKSISINKIANILSISPDTAKRYLEMFESAYLVNVVRRYGKTNEYVLSPPKIYLCDNGIKNIFTGFRDKGALFEAVVYQHLKKKNPRYVLENSVEIDFYTDENELYEAKYDAEMSEKQQRLFDAFPAKKKVVVNGRKGLEQYFYTNLF